MESGRTQLHLLNDLAHGGATTQLRRLAKAAAEKGSMVHVGSLGSAINTPVAKSLRESGVSVHSIGRRFGIDPLAAIQLGKLLRKVRPDVIQTWDATSATTFSAKRLLAERKLGARTRWCHTVRKLSAAPMQEAAEASLARLADGVIATTEPILGRLVKLGVAKEKLKLVPNCFDLTQGIFEREQGGFDASQGISEAGTIDQTAARQSLGLSHDAKMIVASLRMDSAERIKEAIWAADLVRVLHPTVSLYLIGDGPARMACERFADKATATGTVQFVGCQDKLSTWIAAADVVWCPAESTGLSTPMLEAMSAAKPTIAANESGRKQVIIEGQTGWLIDWNDRAGWTAATDRLLSDAELAVQIGNAGRSAIAEFSVDQVAKIHEEFLFDGTNAPDQNAPQASEPILR